jgi:hypothetical protein
VRFIRVKGLRISLKVAKAVRIDPSGRRWRKKTSEKNRKTLRKSQSMRKVIKRAFLAARDPPNPHKT